jgi:hypothetical protein
MRVEKANKTRDAELTMIYSMEETIQTLLYNDRAAMLAAYPEFGDKSWVNGYLEEAFSTSVINSLPEVPFPNFSNEDSQSDTLVKAIDIEWNVPRVHLCFWKNANATPTANASTSSPGNWLYLGKISLTHSYGYPEKKHRWFDLTTDNIARKIGEGCRMGVSFQWVDKADYYTLNNVVYSTDAATGLNVSTFTETLPALTVGYYRVDAYRVVDGTAIPVQPTTTLSGRTLTVVFNHESRINPGTIKVLITNVGNLQKLTANDIVSIDCQWSQEILSLQPDFTPTPVVVQGTVNQVTRQRDTKTFNATTTRANALGSQSTRLLGRITNNGATNIVYFKYGSDVTVTGGLIATGTNPSSVSGGYSGSIAVNGGYMDVPTGYTGVISVVTNSGVSSITTDETYTVSG